MEFTSWDAILRPDELEHHGISGMKWGVRKYQNEDGSLTALGKERYGSEGIGRSARKMTRDFNNLDKGYANVAAEHKRNMSKTSRYARKAKIAERKGKTEKAEKLQKKALKYGMKAAQNLKQKKGIENLQWRIIGKAALKGYTTSSKPVTRLGTTKLQRGKAVATSLLIGGAIGGVVAGTMLSSRALKVSGQQVRISKRGGGGTQIVNYNQSKQYQDEERRRRSARANPYYNR